MSDPTDYRARMLKIAAKAGEGHLPSSLSVLDILDTYYGHTHQTEDCFILSKGHAALGLYVVLERYGYIPPDALDDFCAFDSIFGGHPTVDIAGVEATTGSLGHGLPIAVGRALARKIHGVGGRVTCLIGDGEFEEGSCHETLRLAVRYRLDNLIVAVDCNGSNDLSGNNISDLLAAHGLRVHRCPGHDEVQIQAAFQATYAGSPLGIIFETIKGKGIPAMEADPSQWHHRKIKEEEIEGLIFGAISIS